MRQVAQIMGLPFSIDIPLADDATLFKLVFDRLRAIDESFSTYKASSDVSRYRSGLITLDSLSQEQQMVFSACRSWANDTDGYFDAFYQGTYDPSGYVKGWAIQEVSRLIRSAGFRTFCINAGGDVLGASDGDWRWNIALQHPTIKGSTMGTVNVKNQAIATSGTYARGQHIINPKTHRATSSVLSVTVIGEDIIATDVFATALCAMGFTNARTFTQSKMSDYQVLLVRPDLRVFSTLK